MSESDNKSLKFQFVIDQRSFEVTRGAIRQLNEEIRTLVTTAQQAGNSIAAIGRGQGGGQGGAFSRFFGGLFGKSGGVTPSAESAKSFGISSGSLAQAASVDAKALADLTRVSSQSLQKMATDLSASIKSQIDSIGSLRAHLKSLEEAYTSVTKAAGGLGGGGGVTSVHGFGGTSPGTFTSPTPTATGTVVTGPPSGMDGGGGEGGGMRFAPSTGKGWARTGAMVIAGLGAVGSLYQSQFNWAQADAATLGQGYGAAAKRAMYGGDFTTLHALRQIFHRGDDINALKNRAKGGDATTQNIEDFAGAGTGIRRANAVLGAADLSFAAPGNMLKAYLSAPVEQKLEYLKKIEQIKEANQADSTFRARERFTQTWEGMIPAARSLGLGDNVYDTEARLAKSGFTLGDLGGGQSAILGAGGGWGTATKYRDAVMRAQAGHVGSAGAFVAAAAQAGANGAPGYLSGTGLDIGAQNAIGALVSKAAMSSQNATDPTALLSMLQGVSGAGLPSGEQMRIQRQLETGMAATDKQMFGGGLDPLQKSRNQLNAMQVTKDAFAANWLANKFTTGMYAQAIKGEVTPEMKALGLSAQDVAKYGKLTISTSLRNASLSTTPAGKLAAAVIAEGGDFGEYLKKHKITGKEREAAFRDFGAALEMEGYEGGEGMARIMARDFSKLKEGGFLGVGKGRLKAAAKGKGETMQEDARAMKDLSPEEVTASIKDLATALSGNAGLDKSADNVRESFERLAVVVDALTDNTAKKIGRPELTFSEQVKKSMREGGNVAKNIAPNPASRAPQRK